MNTIIIVFVIIAFVVNLGFVIAMLRRKNSEQPAQGGDSLRLILEQMNELNRTVDRKVGDLTKTVDSRIEATSRNIHESVRTQLTESSKLIREVTEGLTKLDETNKQVVSFADQLQNLQNILKNPKQRGILGEYYLETLLKNVMPPGSFEMQYEFPSRSKDTGKVIADAVVFVKDKIIPIDSKFSLENYNRLVEEKNPIERDRLEKAFKQDLRNRIDETSKYIQPENGTMDFAFMFIPHEAIYYDLLVAEVGGMKINTRDLIEYAFKERRVLIVSPTSFLAFLQTVLQGLKALQIEETAKDIVKRVSELDRHLKAFEDYYEKLGNNLSTVVNQYNLGGKEFKKIDKDVLRITGSSSGFSVNEIDKPEELA